MGSAGTAGVYCAVWGASELAVLGVDLYRGLMQRDGVASPAQHCMPPYSRALLCNNNLGAKQIELQPLVQSIRARILHHTAVCW